MTLEGDRIHTVAVIPARGGSVGIPHKNLCRIGGTPLVVRAVRAAQGATTIDLVVVSTDDREIASLADQEGATVIDRPAELSTATASSESAVLHSLDQLGKAGTSPDEVVLIQCTSPFTTSDDIDRCVKQLRESDASCSFTVTPSHRFIWRTHGNNSLVGVNHNESRPRQRRQDLDAEYAETGAVYAMQVAALRSTGHRFGHGAVGTPVPQQRSMEIDSPEDLRLAEALAALGAVPTGALPNPVDLIVLDFDGVLTDNGVFVNEDGTESVRADRSDGLGLAMLRDAGLTAVVLSRETNPVVAARCRKLGLDCEQSVDDKPPAFRRLVERHGARMTHTIYVGNDSNDVGCLEVAGCSVVPADAHHSARAVADVVLSRRGGHGAVRELIDAILGKDC